MSGRESLVEAALRVLNTADPFDKARLGEEIATKWVEGLIIQPYNPNNSQDFSVPDRPARLTNVNNLNLTLIQSLYSNCLIKCLNELRPTQTLHFIGEAGPAQSHAEAWESWKLTKQTGHCA